MDNDSLFIEQAEYIKPVDFIEWSSEHPNENVILKKLTQAGAKVLTGPRGCGKTTLMLKAYNKLSKTGTNGAFPIYVNFKSSLRLEPVYRSKANGGFWFSQWMYLKIYEGIFKSLDDFKPTNTYNFKISLENVKKILSILELGDMERNELKEIDISAYDLEDDINIAMSVVEKARCVLLLDDAAHAFSPEQQRDFFDFFRKIKSRNISPKAAIYPGVTNFAPTFNIGHDAEEVNAWINPEDDDYIEFMTTLLSKRLPNVVFKKISNEPSLFKIMCYASFGIPRILLNMVRNIYEEKGENIKETYNISFTRRKVFNLVKTSNKSTMAIYTSLELKLPTYKSYVEEGTHVFNKMIELIKSYNKEADINKKSITLAIKKNVDTDLKKILGFFQYAGLISHKGQISKGEKGVFDLYMINLASLIDNNAIIIATNSKTDDIAKALETRNAHAFTRTQSDYLLPKDNSTLSLSLPPCQNCGQERNSEEAKFCTNCGTPLQGASIYKELINKDIKVLPLTTRRINAIKKHSSIKNVRDILYDIGHEELRSVPRVGEYWALRIYNVAEEYIS